MKLFTLTVILTIFLFHAYGQMNGTYLLRNLNGRTFWDSEIAGENGSFYCGAHWMNIHPDDSPTLSLIKLDKSGSMEWVSKIYFQQGGLSNHSFPIAKSPSMQRIYCSADNRICAIDSSGQIIWKRIYTSCYIKSLTALYDGGLIAFGDNGYVLSYPNLTIFKIDSIGNIIWSKKFSVGTYNKLIKVFELNTNLLVVGFYTDSLTNKNGSFFFEMDSFGNVTNEFVLNNISVTQIIREFNTANFYYCGYDSTNAILLGKINLQAGNTWLNKVSNNSYSKICQQNDSIFLFVKNELMIFDTSCQLLTKYAWDISTNPYMIDATVNEGRALAIFHTGETVMFDLSTGPPCALTPDSNNISSISLSQSIPVIHFDTITVTSSAFTSATSDHYSIFPMCTTTTTSSNLESESGFQIFPTIVTNQLFIENIYTLPDEFKLTVFEITGKKVINLSLSFMNDRINDVDVTVLRPGTYLLNIWNKDGVYFRGRFIKK
jgi:hypothetical protein